MCPWLSRPPFWRIGSSRERSGSTFVISAKSGTERSRVPALVGRSWRIPIFLALEDLDGVALFEPDVRLLPPRPPPRAFSQGAALAPLLQRANPHHGDVEQPLDGR